MTPPRSLLGALVCSLALSACGKGDSQPQPTPAATSAAPPAKPEPAPKPAATPSAAPASTPAAAPSAAAPGAASGKGGIFSGLPKTSSKVPTVAEWNAAPEITDIPGIWPTAKYEIKNVREWFKITVKPFPTPHGQKFAPDPVKVTKGKDGNVFEFTSKDDAGLTSVVFPMVEGKDREFVFAYSSAAVTMTMTASWAKGAPQATLRCKTVEGK